MYRRGFIYASIVAAVSGCASGGESSVEPTPTDVTQERTATPTATVIQLGSFEEALERNRISVQSVKREGDSIKLVYQTREPTTKVIGEEIGSVAAVFAHEITEEWAIETLRVRATNAIGKEVFTFQIRSKWALQFANDEINSTEYREHIISTLDLNRARIITESPTPTPSPTPSPTRTPTSTPIPDGETYTFDSEGNRVTDSFEIEGGLTSFDMSHDGESNFILELIDNDSGDSQELLANEIGYWEGLLPFYVPKSDYVLDVEADGNWEIIVRQPRDYEGTSPPVTGSDEYPNYLGPISFEGYHIVSGKYEGDSNFIVSQLNSDGEVVESLFNEIGEFDGETTTSYSGLGYVRVEATGDWEVDVD